MPDRRRYVVKETMVSFVANGLVNSIVVWAVFGGRAEIPLFGTGGIAIDFVPQLGMISLIGYIVPSLLTRNRIKDGTLHSSFGTAPIMVKAILRRAVLTAVWIIFGLGAAATAILAASFSGPYSFLEVFAIKSIIGCAVPLVVTPMAIKRASQH